MRTVAVVTDTLDCLTVEMKIRENNLVTEVDFRLSKIGFSVQLQFSRFEQTAKKNAIDKAFSIFFMRLCSSS